jgi:hypothetical protein
MGAQIRWSKAKLLEFQQALADAESANLDLFQFDGTMFPVRYARYISAYLGSRL